MTGPYLRLYQSSIFLLVLLLAYAALDGLQQQPSAVTSTSIVVTDFSNVAELENHTCEELKRWLGSEKHYSNHERRKYFFSLQIDDEICKLRPVLMLSDMTFGYDTDKKRSRPSYAVKAPNRACQTVHDKAVVMLSNFSIKHNFSHFLHALLRLFCSLLDARYIVWDTSTKAFFRKENFTLWLDEYLPMSDMHLSWYHAMASNIQILKDTPQGRCILAKTFLYGNGCTRLLPPEKWFGYPGCRARSVLPAFATFMRHQFHGPDASQLVVVDEHENEMNDRKLRVSFATRAVGSLTGRRVISNLDEVQGLLKKTQRIRATIENITFEHLDVPSTVRYMAGVHIFVSVHGAGMTNIFFMNPGSAIVEIIPFPLCNCQSPDYFFGVGGYYHGAAMAQGIRHYHYCVGAEDTMWNENERPNVKLGGKCNWKHLHAVDAIKIDPTRFVALMRNVERDMIIATTIRLTQPVISMNPNANGR